MVNLSQKELEDGGIYLVYYDNRMWIKQAKENLSGMTFISINEAYSHLIYKEEEVRVVAKAILSFNTF